MPFIIVKERSEGKVRKGERKENGRMVNNSQKTDSIKKQVMVKEGRKEGRNKGKKEGRKERKNE